MNSRYIVGIDLGTTSCALSYLDTLDIEKGVRQLKIDQWDKQQEVVSSDLLPSFCYLPPKNICKNNSLKLPFHNQDDSFSINYVVGKWARRQASLNPDRVIHSAKSWLCHNSIEGNTPILPWHSDSIIGDQKYSPVQVSSLLLEHLKNVWNSIHAKHENSYCLENQNIILTVPASFSEVSSSLTLQAAEDAGFDINKIRLLEEPQAAFYFWQFSLLRNEISKKNNTFSKSLAEKVKEIFPFISNKTATIFVCDIGGGTSDFTLLQISEKATGLKISRVAVSDHLLLGGDNIDLSLAHFLENKFCKIQKKEKLNSKEWAYLLGEARLLKEKALNLDADELQDDKELFVAIAGSGSNIFGKSQSIGITIKEIKNLILNGFFPECSRSALPETAQDGLQEWGLPYASDGSITKHIAKFLNSRSVDGVLFTGGTLKPFLIQNCIINLIEKWQKFKPVYLENKKMDLAVSHGASYFGVTSLVDVAKVESSYPRNLFIEVSLGENHKKGLLCILSKGYNGENAIILDQIPLKVILNKAVSFPVSYSLEDSTVKAGDIIIDWKKCETKYKPLASLKTRLHIPSELKKIKKLPSELMISLRVNLSQTGLLSIDCLAKEGHNLPLKPLPSWKLKFSLNENDRNLASDEKVNEAIHSHHIDEQKFKEANEVIGRLYGKANVSNKIEAKPSNLFRDLEKCLGLSRQEWPLHFLRPLWDSLLAGATRRNRSDKHLTSWLSLAGYILRPGYGQQQDVFRVNDLWSAMEDGALNPKAKQAQIQWYIMLRRVAGGLNKEQQNKIYSKIAPAIKKSECGPEAFLLVGSLEYLEMNQKIKLAKMLIKQILAKRPEYLDQKIWALARISSRVPLYGSGETIVRPCFIEAWFEDLKNIDHSNSQYHSLRYFYSQAGRIVDDREFDISNELREKFISCLESMKAKSSLIEPLKSFVPMDDEGKQNLFGEKLPAGFVLEI